MGKVNFCSWGLVLFGKNLLRKNRSKHWDDIQRREKT